MARHAFHLTPHASGPLYQFISSPTLRIIQLCLILFAIFFFSVGLGLASKSIPPAPYWDLGVNNDFCDKLALGVAFLPVLWLGFLLLWHVLRKPKIHPGYYIGFDLYLGLSYLSAMPVLFIFSAYFLAADQVCSSSPCQGLVSAIRGLYGTAYVLTWIAGIMHCIFFGVACRVCDVYNREKKANKTLVKKGVKLESQSRSSSQEHIV